MPSSNGGFMAPLGLELIPGNNVFWYYNTANFNDTNSPSYWYWKVEPLAAGRVPTINRVIILYRDFGVATPELIINYMTSTTNPLTPNTPQTSTTPLTIGTTLASGKICALIQGVNVTGTNLQVGIYRAANAGPVSITNLRVQGGFEDELG